MRFIGMDVHRDFCDVGAADVGGVRSLGRVATTPVELERFARALHCDDEVTLEATGNAAAIAIARILAPHVTRVLVANPRRLSGVVGPRAKTDRLDARVWPGCSPAG